MKRCRGFTILEVLIAIGIFSSFLVLILRQQIFSVRREVAGTSKVDRIFYLEKYFFKPFFSPPKKAPRKKKLEEPLPTMEIDVSMQGISRKSALKDVRENMVRLGVRGSWGSGVLAEEIELVGFVAKPKDTKKK